MKLISTFDSEKISQDTKDKLSDTFISYYAKKMIEDIEKYEILTSSDKNTGSML